MSREIHLHRLNLRSPEDQTVLVDLERPGSLVVLRDQEILPLRVFRLVQIDQEFHLIQLVQAFPVNPGFHLVPLTLVLRLNPTHL